MTRLTAFSPGAGCGCKISPAVLETILATANHPVQQPSLLVNASTRDDAAVLDLGNGQALISTTDFFMPVCDDAFDFGRIAAANAISDVYAMGGKPVLAVSILGWPLEKLPPELASQVLEGARSVCTEAGIALAGGHSIDSLEPIFGLAVSGLVDVAHLKRNSTAQPGDLILLTKPLGVGILTTAQKKDLLKPEHAATAIRSMTALNKTGETLGKCDGVNAMTDVTGFGLLGHLIEMCEGNGLSAELNWDKIPVFEMIPAYLDQDCIPGGTFRNWKSYGHKVGPLTEKQKTILCDPQTNGGLLFAVRADQMEKISGLMKENNQEFWNIGHFYNNRTPVVSIR
ncbi:MAG TPA: selenide, water dikinase SelD [Bacteroidales bacterium]|nr:selenide, water dikinase SelD [Bacteroidales bacterium]HSA43017.1 selenide, water dikinase SelD [Bacteroidales bacterium]